VESRAATTLARALQRHDRISAEEQRILGELPWRIKEFAVRSEIVKAGSQPSDCCMILEGFAARAQYLGDGKRQLTALHIPGDFVDLHSFTLKTMDHSVMALNRCLIALVGHEAIGRVTEVSPHLTRLFWMSTNVDAAIQRAWIVRLGQLSSEGHMAHLLCEIYLRLKAVDLASEWSFELPITQTELADFMGRSTVHVNRTLQALRTRRLVSWDKARVQILNWERLQKVASFDATYLNLVRKPR
jgi:CRP-like cAMP-binding protein